MDSKNWPLNSYTNATWTNLVDEAAIVTTLVISNTGPTNVTLELRVFDNPNPLTTLLPPTVIAPGESWALETRSIHLTGTQKLQMKADLEGLELFASGVV